MTINDTMNSALTTLGYTGGSLNDKLLRRYKSDLSITASRSINDLEVAWLKSKLNVTHSRSVNDLWASYLISLGYSGSLNDMKLAFWTDGGGGASYFWDAFPQVQRLHDAQNADSLTNAVGAAVTSWEDASSNSLAAYTQTGGTGVTVAASGGLKYVQGSSTTGYLDAASGTNLRGSELWLILKTSSGTSDFAVGSSSERIEFRSGAGVVRIYFGATLYGTTFQDSNSGVLPIETETWHTVRIIFAETKFEIWINQSLHRTITSAFSGTPSDAFSLSRLLANAGGFASDAALALVAVVPAVGETGALTTTQISSIWTHINAQRDTLSGA